MVAQDSEQLKTERNKIKPKILVLPHGQTETEFIKHIIEIFFHHKTKEKNKKETKPIIIEFNDTRKVQSTEIEKRLIEKIDDKLFITQNFNLDEIENSNIYLIVVMDVFEDGSNNAENERDMISDNNVIYNIIINALKSVDLSKHFDCESDNEIYLSNSDIKVKFIYFEKGIEYHFQNFDPSLSLGPKQKPRKMRVFMKRKSNEISNVDELQNFITEIKSNEYKNNVIEIIDFLNIAFEDYF